jgi:hypothetical protein
MKTIMKLAPIIAIATALVGAASGRASTSDLTDTFVNQSTAQNSQQIDKSVRDAMFSAREAICSDIDGRIAASENTMTRLKAYSDNLTTDAKASFDAAVKDANAREQDLKKSLELAVNAGTSDWEGARASVATHYNLYSEAVAHAEALVLAGVAASASATVAGIVK